MKTITGFASLALISSALVGCAADASLDASAREKVATTTAADTADYLQTFDQDFQAIIFQPRSAIDWVILHVTIDGTRTTNVPMPETGTSAAAGPSYEIGSLPVLPGDSVVYSFTYSVKGLAYDTPQFVYTLPAAWIPRTFFTQVSEGEIAAVSTASLLWADVHYTVNGGVQENVRLQAEGSRYVQPITLAPGDVLTYSVTYDTGAAVFDTALATYVAPADGARFVVDLGADSTTGVCAANGVSGGQCNLRAALLAARGSVGSVTIELAVDSIVNGGQIELATPGTSAVVIESAPDGAARAINGNGTTRLFAVDAGVALTMKDVTIANFRAVDSGGAITNNGTLDLEGVTLASNVTDCSGTGAMTAFATCSGGAIANAGSLTLGGGTRFSNNSVTADASTASFTNAWAGGGAILSSGSIAIVGPVTFSGNAANAQATSGYHNVPIGGATASAAGGAIYTTGSLRLSESVQAGACQFTSNTASASGESPEGTTTFTSRGGAIENAGSGTVEIPVGACVFSGNSAQSGADIDG